MSPINFDARTTTGRLADLSARYMPTTKSGTPRHALYDGSRGWTDEAVWRKFQLTPHRLSEVFVTEECQKLVSGLLTLTRAVGGSTNPSFLLRFVAAVASRHLEILAHLESVKRTVFDAALIHPADTSSPEKRPLKDHVLHAGCVLDAAIALLDQTGHDGQKLFLRLFDAMRQAYDNIFTGPEAAPNPLANITSDAERKAFVTDCCVGAVLAHDNGYLPMFEVHLGDAHVGHLIGFLKRKQSAREELRGWLDKVTGKVSAQLVRDGADVTAITLLLPPFTNAWMTEKDLNEKPDKLHGSVSGYQLLDYFFCSKTAARKALVPAEQWMLLMIAGASIFHGAELPALCDPILSPEDIADRSLLRADLARSDNPVRQALVNEPDGASLLQQADEIEGDDSCLLAVLTRLNAWIDCESLQNRSEFQQSLKRNPSYELRELLRGREKDKGEHAEAWQTRLNRLILEASLQGLRPALDHTLARVWAVNPLGLYLYAVDAMQEWVRLTWETTHSNDTGPNVKPLQKRTAAGTKSVRLLSQHLGLNQIEGLKVIIGQSPIPKTVIEFFPRGRTSDRTERIEIRYPEVDPPENRFVTQYGFYDYRRITGDFQKARTIPAAMRLITGCARVDCILPDRTEVALDAVVDALEGVVREVAGRDELPELSIPSTGTQRKRRRAAVKPHLKHIDIHGHEAYRTAAALRFRDDLNRIHESLRNPSVADHGPTDLDKWLKDCVKATTERFRAGDT